MDTADKKRIRQYYSSLSDEALRDEYELGPTGYIDAAVWQLVEEL